MKSLLTSLSFLIVLSLGLSAEPKPQEDLPSAKPDTVIPLLNEFKPTMNFQHLLKILGTKYTDIGSGIYVLVYKLEDGSTVTVGTPDKKSVIYIDHFDKVKKKNARIYDKTTYKNPKPNSSQ